MQRGERGGCMPFANGCTATLPTRNPVIGYLNKIDKANLTKLAADYWDKAKDQDEAAWHSTADRVVEYIFKPTALYTAWSSQYCEAFGKFVSAIDRLCVDRSGPEGSFSSLLVPACRQRIQALFTAQVPEGSDAHHESMSLRSGLTQGVNVLGVMFLEEQCSIVAIMHMVRAILRIDGAVLMEAQPKQIVEEGQAVIHLMSGAPLATRPEPNDTVMRLVERIGRELEIPALRINLLADGTQLPRHVSVNELGNASLMALVWSPALTEDHRIEVACALLSTTSSGLRATDEGQRFRFEMLAHLAKIKAAYTIRLQCVIDDFLEKEACFGVEACPLAELPQ